MELASKLAESRLTLTWTSNQQSCPKADDQMLAIHRTIKQI